MSLYPPIIDSKLPAFEYSRGTVKIIVPYKMNRSVGRNDFTKFNLLVKTISSSTEVARIEYTLGATESLKDTIEFTFNNTNNTFLANQFYKVQLAYQNGSEIGIYSSIGIIKCTKTVNVSIENLNNSIVNDYLTTYVGKYMNEDSTEKVYTYYFNIFDNENNLHETSGLLTHNSSKDSEQNISYDEWSPTKGLITGKQYKIQYGIITINGFEKKSPEYEISNNYHIAPSDFYNTELEATLYKDDGYVELKLVSDTNLTGRYILNRSSSKDNFQTWNPITTITVSQHPSGLVVWKDFTIEQGVEYMYSLQLTNSHNIKSVHMANRGYKIQADFEDLFLFDGTRQLKIRFNPKVSSFKTTTLETKTDTIGGKYPHFFRNGNVAYKEIPISGLISILSDENEYFMTGLYPIEPTRPHTDSPKVAYEPFRTQLTAQNFVDERDFKLAVADWLNNGQPKLFRSPGEGNYIVRLMNVSLSPNDTLGRMLHTFSCTAYEIMDCNFNTIKDLGFLNVAQEQNYLTRHVTTRLNYYDTVQSGVFYNPTTGKIETQDGQIMKNIVITNAIPFSRDFRDSSNNAPQADINGTIRMNNSSFITISNPLQLQMSILDFDYDNVLPTASQDGQWSNITKVEPNGTQSFTDIYSTKLYKPSAGINELQYDKHNAGYLQWDVNDKNPDYSIDYLKYLNDRYGIVGEVSYLRIYNRKYDNSFSDEGFGQIDKQFAFTDEEFAHVGLQISVKSYTNDVSYVLMKDGSRVYRDLGVLSELKCGNSYSVDIVYNKKKVTRG